MAVWTSETLNPTLIENTNMTKQYMDGAFKLYGITPNEGYVLHDNGLDWIDVDTGDLVLGYTYAECTCGARYDFAVNDREFYAVEEGTVPGDQIFAATRPSPEAM